MSRSTKGLKILPALYRKRTKLGESMVIKENKEAWLVARERNLKKLKSK